MIFIASRYALSNCYTELFALREAYKQVHVVPESLQNAWKSASLSLYDISV